MLNVTHSINNESTNEEIRAASTEMWAYLYGKWTWKNGLLPFNPNKLQKLEQIEEPELAKVWRQTNVEVTRAWSAVNTSRSGTFDWSIDSWGESKSVAAEFDRMLDSLDERKAAQEKAVELTEELLQVEMAGGRAEYEAFDARRWAIHEYNGKIDSLISLQNELAKQLAVRAEKKAQRKADRLAKKAEQVA